MFYLILQKTTALQTLIIFTNINPITKLSPYLYYDIEKVRKNRRKVLPAVKFTLTSEPVF